MQQRVNIEKTLPGVWKAMYHLSGVLTSSKLTAIQKHLITMRASQLNGCAFCINMHTQEALQAGEHQQRIFLLSVWQESRLFTPEEQAILSLTEEVTLIHQHGVSDETYNQARAFFDDQTLGEIISLVVVINAWNRIAVSTQLAVQAV
ncbi:carboxymuconolactone decarboxylase family protein [Spirosoma endophyticum]|uniref:Alkylhydroperoxidase AhpD family core domain-containing protein n=1 Tax=Spirosoma endophyticum TaxID=662367 RepID=A0A1I1Z456_9BACT|nr:carboxymuconolactone decarboxylase family protein [Spirosoma endophyticum]SFE26332.1 alkylhydroperoxidase AhpD family core domain-containing protein [Spirosoma endophyticum]